MRAKVDKEMDSRIVELVNAWNDYPDGFRATLMLEWPDLFFAVSRVVRYVEAAPMAATRVVDRGEVSARFETIGTAPEGAPTPLRGLTKSTHTPSKTRGI